MRSKLMWPALSVAVLVSLTVPAAAQLPSDPQPPLPKRIPPKPVPPGLAKDCAARIGQDNPKTKIVGPFFTATQKGPIARYLDDKAGNVVIGAPSRTPDFMDRIVRHYSGCYYDMKNGVLVFSRLTRSGDFPPRRAALPGEE